MKRLRAIIITAVAFMLIWLLRFVAFHLDVFNPVAQGIKGFSTTDIFYDMMLATPADTSSTIVIVDITQLHDRDSIATALEEIDALEPAAIDIDVVFEHPKEPVGDAHLFNVAATLSNAVFSFKMMDPDREQKEFTRQVHSFFAKDLGVTEGFVNVDRKMTRDIPLCLEMRGKAYPSFMASHSTIRSIESSTSTMSRPFSASYRTIPSSTMRSTLPGTLSCSVVPTKVSTCFTRRSAKCTAYKCCVTR